jgi:hypothetical protein
MRLDYLKKHRKGTYTTLVTTCKLNEHLYETEQEAKQQIELTLSLMVKERSITEALKAANPLKWRVCGLFLYHFRTMGSPAEDGQSGAEHDRVSEIIHL